MNIENLISACCECHSIKFFKDYVNYGEIAYNNLVEQGNVTHGYCPRCEEKACYEIDLISLELNLNR